MLIKKTIMFLVPGLTLQGVWPDVTVAFETRPASELLRAQTRVSLFQLQKRQFSSQKHFREQDSAEVKEFRLLVTSMSFPEKSIPSSRLPPQSCGVVVVGMAEVPEANVVNQIFMCNFEHT